MSENEIVLLESIINDPRNSHKISNLLAVVPELPKQSLKQVMKIVSYELFSSKKSQTQLQCIRILKYLMMLQNPFIVSKVNLNIAPKFLSLFSFAQDLGKFNLWIDSRLSRQKSLFKFAILTLKCIEYWAEVFKFSGEGEYSQIFVAYSELKDLNVEFPPSFFLQAYEPINKKYLKKDLRKVNRFCQEFEYLISVKAVRKVKVLKKILTSFEKTLEVHAEFLKNQEVVPDEGFRDARSRVKSNIFKFMLWKSSNFTEVFDPVSKISVLVLDPFPKSEPLNEVQRESFIADDLSSSKSSLSQIDDIPDDYDYKEGLSSMYKQDLCKLQDNYIKISEEKEAYTLKIKALETQALDLSQLISDQKQIINEYSRENSALLKSNTSLTEINSFLSSKVEELNVVLDNLEKSKLYQSRVVENLENNNELLLLSNKNLKEEISDLRKCKESLLEQIHIMETYTERNEWVEKNETIKNIPNDSVGSALGHKLKNVSEKSLFKISSFDIFTDDEGYDNEHHFFEYLQKGEGAIFEDEKIRIVAEFEVSGKKCEGCLRLINKTDKKVSILVEISSFPKEFNEFSMPTGNFRLKTGQEVLVSVKILASKIFYDSPIVKITYESLHQTKFIKLPVSAWMFFKKNADEVERKFDAQAEKKLKVKSEEWKMLKRRIALNGNRIRVGKGGKSVMKVVFISVFGNCCLEIGHFGSELVVKACGSSQLIANVFVKNLCSLICFMLFKV